MKQLLFACHFVSDISLFYTVVSLDDDPDHRSGTSWSGDQLQLRAAPVLPENLCFLLRHLFSDEGH